MFRSKFNFVVVAGLLFANLLRSGTGTGKKLLVAFRLGESVMSTFWVAMILIASGVALGQANLRSVQTATTIAQPE